MEVREKKVATPMFCTERPPSAMPVATALIIGAMAV